MNLQIFCKLLKLLPHPDEAAVAGDLVALYAEVPQRQVPGAGHREDRERELGELVQSEGECWRGHLLVLRHRICKVLQAVTVTS